MNGLACVTAGREALPARLGMTKDVNMRRLLLLVLAASLNMADPAQAEKVDLSTITCKRFFEYSKENVSLMLMWLDGYYQDDDDDPVVDFDKMADNAKKLGEYCGKNPTHTIITAAEKTIVK
jgi:acid stress chaperone HdeB